MLAKEPFNKSFAEIGAMTPYQVRHILFRDEKKHDPFYDHYTREKELFWKVNKKWRGRTEEEVAALWREHVAKNPQLSQMLPPGLPPH